MTTRSTPPALLIALLVSVLPASAEDPQVAVHTAAVRAVEVAEAAPVPPDLRAWASKLEKLPGAHRFELLGQSVRRGPPGAPLVFSLPAEHEAQVVAVGRPDGRVDVRVVITRPGKQPGTREQVLAHEVVVDDGGTWVVRLQDALGRGEHLLLLMTAGARGG
ncbi:MAG: hypothetical protein KF878_06495 [Planctomycetes bacterium]|nr:hypothetical protein [Planctomycetota bacterium]